MSAESGEKLVLDYPDVAALIADAHPHEVLALAALAKDETGSLGDDAVLARARGADPSITPAQIERALGMLGLKRIASQPLVAREDDPGRSESSVELTDAGRQAAIEGTPETVLFALLADGPLPASEVTRDARLRGAGGTALGALKKAGVVTVENGAVRRAAVDSGEFARLQALLVALAGGPRSRRDCRPEDWALLEAHHHKRATAKGLVRITETKRHRYRLATAHEAVRAAVAGAKGQVGQLTPDMLRDGSWKGNAFRRWNIGLTPAPPPVGRRNPYREYLDSVKRKLTSMGFVEMVGNLVETEFWNCDALYMPQFHPAREIHDVYMVKEPGQARELHPTTAAAVAAAHESGGGTGSTGWRYHFDLERAKQLILRSHGTVLSARTLGSRPPVPSKFFSVARCFRSDTVDATHAADFFQIEGIVLGADINFRHLLGLLRLFGYEVARAKECRFVPAYFPFTEPSVEVHMRHPTLGWMELGGSGIFRPELTKPLGIDVPVIAWGLGIDRMAMVALGINDIRDLFHTELSQLRQLRIP